MWESQIWLSLIYTSWWASQNSADDKKVVDWWIWSQNNPFWNKIKWTIYHGSEQRTQVPFLKIEIDYVLPSIFTNAMCPINYLLIFSFNMGETTTTVSPLPTVVYSCKKWHFICLVVLWSKLGTCTWFPKNRLQLLWASCDLFRKYRLQQVQSVLLCSSCGNRLQFRQKWYPINTEYSCRKQPFFWKIQREKTFLSGNTIK